MNFFHIITFYLIFRIQVEGRNSDREAIRKEQGNLMKMYMNDSVDPCDNFYKYACGNWAVHNPIAEKKQSFDVLGLLTLKVNSFMKEAILKENLTLISNEYFGKILSTDIVKKVQSYYSMCVRGKLPKYEPYVEAFGVPGGWPALNDSWSKDHFDWLNVTAHLKLFGVESLFDAVVGPHYNDATRNFIYISSASFPFFRRIDYLYQRNHIVQLMIIGMIKMPFTAMGINQTYADEITEKILKFEIELARISPSESEEENDNSEDMTLETLCKLLPEIDWKRFLEIILGDQIDTSQRIVVLNRPYLTNLIKLLNQTDAAVIANFFLYRFSLNIGTLFSKLEEYCTNEAVIHMGSVLGSVYIQAFNDEQSNADVEQIVTNVKWAFADAVQETDWMDHETIVEAVNKLNTIIPKIGASKEHLSNENLNEEFKDLEFDSEDYYTNYLRLLKHTTRKPYKTLERINSRNEWNYNPAVVNAFYDTPRNVILIPTSMLQTPIYNYHLPNSIKYGSLGSIIGHELTHSLDASGSEYDSNGNMRNWWTKKSTEEYINRTKCLVEQYNNYLPIDLNSTLESMNTLDENISDNGGIRQAYRAYTNWLHENSETIELNNEILPELNLTNKQLFFLSFAQFYCQVVKPTGVFISLLTDEHSMNQYRVIGSLSNFDEFSKEFQCPVGSPMNPVNKCKIW